MHLATRRLALATAALLCLGTAQAQTWPSKPIRAVVPFAAGSATDQIGRAFAEKMAATLGQPVVIDNKPGANGMLGADIVAKAPADGYTILIGTNSTNAALKFLMKQLPYDQDKAFTPVGFLGSVPLMVAVNNDVPAKNLKDFIALGKKEGKMTFASSGSGTSIHVSGELFKTMTGIDMVHVPYKGRATAIPDVLGGRVTMMFDNMPSSLALVREGKLRALGVTSAQRSPAAPEIPTIAESGLPGFDAVSWFALFAPAGTPKPIVDKWATEVRRVLKLPDVAKRLADNGLEPVGSTPEELAAYQRAEITKWAKVVKDSGAKAD